MSISRYVKKNVTFSNGITVPKGSVVTASAFSAHMEEGSYHDPYVFKPFRFSDVRDDVEGESTKHQMVATSPDYLAFGLGKHAWCVSIGLPLE